MHTEPFKISLRAARVNADMTQDDAAHALGMSKQTIVNWETGRTEPRFADVCRMAELYKIPIEMLDI